MTNYIEVTDLKITIVCLNILKLKDAIELLNICLCKSQILGSNKHFLIISKI